MSNAQQIDKAIESLEQAMQALRDLGLITDEDEQDEQIHLFCMCR